MKRKKFVWLLLSSLMALSLVLASCTTEVEEEEEEVVEEEEEEPPEGANWWDKFGEPEYGGTLTVRSTRLSHYSADPSQPGGVSGPLYETLFDDDWTLDRDIYSFKGAFCPSEYRQGLLAESWELIDPQTMNVYLRQGIKWHDKPPVNGRELTAEDVQYNYDRFLGTGSGFTEPNPFLAGMVAFTERAVAIDKYTVQFKFKTLSSLVVFDPMQPQVKIVAPEWVEQYSDTAANDWKLAVGSGAWFVTDFVPGSTLKCSKNPNYWGYDERHPENRLPYIDTYKQVAIADMSTALAALRTGKIDTLIDVAGGPSWQQAASIAKTNPEIQQGTLPSEAACLDMRCDKEPFTDINVRKALQMAIDIETIAETHYGGFVEGTPVGLIPPMYTGWATPYDEWPADLQEEYCFNPERARALLSEAGYPNGFKTNVIASSSSDLTLLEIIKSYFMDIGVDMEIKVMDEFAAMDFMFAGKHDQMGVARVAHMINPWQSIIVRQTGESRNYTFNNDPTFDAMIKDCVTAIDLEETKRLIREADIYCLRQHWSANVCIVANVILWQPYIKGYSDERWGDALYLSRVWIDQDLKASMGR